MAEKQTSIRLNSLLTGAALVLMALLLAWLSVRYPYESDWTRGGRHTLSEASIRILAGMDGPLEITAYAREQEALREVIKRFIGRYQRNKTDIVLRFVNPDAVPDEVRNLGVNINGELVLHYQGSSEHVRAINEEAFTNALQRLLRGTEHWLAFIEGHGERDPLGKANHDIGQWVQQLSRRGFQFQPINLTQIRTVPDNTSILVIAGPLVDLLVGEVEAILNYLATGGNLLWLVEPNALKGMGPVAEYLGVAIPAGTVIDFAGKLVGIDDPGITLVTQQLYGPHPAVANLGYATLFPRATAININEDSDWNVTPILTTGEHTWQETGELKDEVSFDEEADQRGPLSIGLGLERVVGERQQRVVVLGDGDFISNTYLANSGNLDLGIRLINWLGRDDDFIAIPAHTAEDIRFNISSISAGIIGFGFLVVLPLCLFGAGVYVWWRRRNL